MNIGTSRTFRRQAAAVPSARAFVDHALRSADVPPHVAEPLVLAVAEACNNAILHAEGDTFKVTIRVEDSTCTATVSDLGRGFDPPHRPRMPSPEVVDHRGLAMMAALVDDVKFSSSTAGTTVVLVHGGVGPAALAQPVPLVAER